jgi:iron complex transport system permease protein
MVDLARPIYVADLADRADQTRRLTVGLLAVFVSLTVMGSFIIGPANVGLLDIGNGLLRTVGLRTGPVSGGEAIATSIRIPRTFLGLFCGIALGVSGAALQGLFRNPLVDPQLIGVSSGGAFGAAFWIVFGGSLTFVPLALSGFMTALFAFAGALTAMTLVFQLGSRRGHVSVATMLLAGIAMNALAASGLGLLLFLSDDAQMRAINFWTMGSLGTAGWVRIWPALLIMGLGSLWLLRDMRALNLLAIGEDEAKHLGCDTRALKRRLVILPALVTAAAVSVTGIIGFVGLVAPHLVRLMAGSDHRIVMPGAALLGGGLLLLSDIVARTITAPAELPIGIVTSLIGAPFFIWLLSRYRGISL